MFKIYQKKKWKSPTTKTNSFTEAMDEEYLNKYKKC